MNKKIILSSIIIASFLHGANQGESLFATKDDLNIKNFVNSNVKISNQNYGNYFNEKNNNNNELDPESQRLRDISELEMANAQREMELLRKQEQEIENLKNNSNYARQEQYQTQNVGQISQEELLLLKASVRNQNLKAIQKKFHNKKYIGFENTSEIKFEKNKTQKIRTRLAMATTLIFETDIESYILGDTTGFRIEEVPSKPNTIAVRPLLIGIDTSLTIFTKDKKLHTFYLFSTDYKNTDDPNFVIYIKDEDTQAMLKEKALKNAKDYLVIKDGLAELIVPLKDIDRNYEIKAKSKNEWLMPQEIFSDKKFTYFKYEKEKMPQIPTIFAVIDKIDSPIETRIIGDYLIVETINPAFTIKSGDSYVCVKRSKIKE